MEFNPYGSFLDFSRQDWSLGDDNDDDDLGNLKSNKGDQDSQTKKREGPSYSPLPDVSDDDRDKEFQQDQNGDLSRKKSIRSDPTTSVTAASTEPQEPFSFEISLPPGLDVSPLSCKESVIASMISRSADEELPAPPLVIRTGPTNSHKSSRARSKSRSRRTPQDPPASHERPEKEPPASHGRSHSKERTRGHSSERRSKRRSRSREHTRQSRVDEPTPSHSNEHSRRTSSRERRALKTSRSRSMDPTSHDLEVEEESAHVRHRTSSTERRSRRSKKTESIDPTFQASHEETRARSDSKERVKASSSSTNARSSSKERVKSSSSSTNARSTSKERVKSSSSSTKSGPTSRSKSIDPSRRSSGDPDHERRRRTRSISMVRSKKDDRSKRSQSMVRANALEEIIEHTSDHSSSRRGRKRSPSSSRHSSKSTSVNPSSVESQSLRERNRESTSSSRSRSKSRTRNHDSASPRISLNKARNENNLTTVQELSEFTEPVEDIPPPPPPPSRHNSLSSPSVTSKDVDGRRSSQDLSPRPGSTRGFDDTKRAISHESSPSPRRHKSIDGSNDKPSASPRSHSIGSRRRASRRSTDPATSSGDAKRSHVNKWSQLRQMNIVKPTDDSRAKDSGVSKEVDGELADFTKQTIENARTDVLVDSVMTSTSGSHQGDFAGNLSPGGKSKHNLVNIQPKLQSVMIRPKQADLGITDTHSKPPASPALSASTARKSIQTMPNHLSSPRMGRAKEKRGSNDADSDNGSTSKSPSLAAKLKESQKAATGSGKASTASSRAGSVSEGSHSLGSGFQSRLKDTKAFNDWQVNGTNELIGHFSTDTFLIDNDAVLVAPKITPVILHTSNTSTTTTSTNPLKVDSPSRTHKAISRISEHSDSAASVERLKRANELIQEQKRKKEASRSRQKALEESSRSSLSFEQSPTQTRGADLVTSKSETAASSPRAPGWGLLKSMRASSRRLGTSESLPPSLDLVNDQKTEQNDDTIDVDQSAKPKGLKGASEFVKAATTRVSSRRESRRRSQNEEGAEPRKPASSKWKDLSRRLHTKDTAKSSKGLDPPEEKELENGMMGNSPDRSPQRRLSKWTGLKGARAFIAGRNSEHHKLLLSDDGLM